MELSNHNLASRRKYRSHAINRVLSVFLTLLLLVMPVFPAASLAESEGGLVITKTGASEHIRVNQNITYTLKVDNLSETDLTNVIVTDDLPGGFIYVSSDATLTGSNPLTWNIGPMAKFTTKEIKLVARAERPGEFENVARVTSEEITKTEPAKELTMVDPCEPRPHIDASISKSDMIDPIEQGDPIQYEIVVRNTGNTTITDARVSENLPGDATFLGSNPKPTETTPLYWDLGALAPGKTTKIDLVVDSGGAGEYLNTATLTGTGLVGEKIADETTTVSPEPPGPNYNIEILKTDSVDPVIAGDEVTYYIKVQNTGNRTLNDVVVADKLPDEMTFISSNPTEESSSPLTWDLGDLRPGRSKTISIKTKTTIPGDFFNNAAVKTRQTARESARARTTVLSGEAEPVYDLKISKTGPVDPVIYGNDITYQLRVENSGNRTLTGVTLTEYLPGGISYKSSSLAPKDSDPLTWNLGSLAPGQGTDVTLITRADSTGTFTNQALADSNQTQAECAWHSTVVEDSPLPNFNAGLTKEGSTDTVGIGDMFTYELRAQNSGDSTLTGVTINDKMPSGITYISSQPAASTDTPTLRWDVNDLAPEESTSIIITAKGSAAGQWTNEANINALELTSPIYAYEPTTVTASGVQIPIYSASVTKLDSADPISVTGTTEYTLRVTNTGTGALTNLKLTDTLPGALAFVSSAISPAISANTYIWTIPRLEPGAVHETKFVAYASQTGTHNNVVSLTATELGSPVSANQPTTVVAAPVVEPAAYDLAIFKTDNVDPASVGDVITYEITVKNRGNQMLSDLVIKDSMPTGLEFFSSDIKTNEIEPRVFQWRLETLEPGVSKTFKIKANARATGTWTNTVSVKAKEIPTAELATQQTQVTANATLPVNDQPQNTQGGNSPAGAALPFTGFPQTTWFLAALSMLGAGLLLELIGRRAKYRRALNRRH